MKLLEKMKLGQKNLSNINDATQHELSSKVNESRLDSAIEKLKSESLFQKDLIEL